MTSHDVDREPSRSVLHVLPHPGGGGETYVDSLSAIREYRAGHVYLTLGTESGHGVALVRRALSVQRAARGHAIAHLHGEVAATLFLPSLALRPSVVTLHGLNLLRRLSGAQRRAAKVNLRMIVRSASRTICVSEAEHSELRAVVGARAERRTVVINNGVAPLAETTVAQREAARAALGIQLETVLGVWVGSLEEHKDPLTAVRAALGLARAGADLTLLVVGEGPLRPQVEQAIGEEGGGAVRVLGQRSDVHDILAAADFFVLSSRREGFSYALLEAMTLGLPVVVSDVPGNREAVGDTGILVPCGDAASFGSAFERLLGDERERRRLGALGRERVTRCFGIEEMLCRTRHLYDEVVGEARQMR